MKVIKGMTSRFGKLILLQVSPSMQCTHLLSVGPDELELVLGGLVLLLLLDGGDDPPGGPARADHVLVGDREQVPLLHGELHV